MASEPSSENRSTESKLPRAAVPVAAPLKSPTGPAATPRNGSAPVKAVALQTNPAAQPQSNGAGPASAGAPAKPTVGKQSGASAVKAEPTSIREEMEELEKVGTLPWTQVAPSWLTSVVVHAVLLIILAVIMQPEKIKDEIKDLIAVNDKATDEIEEVKEVTPVEVDAKETDVVDAVGVVADATGVDVTTINDAPAPAANVELNEIGLEKSPVTDLTKEIGKFSGKGLEGRGSAARKALVASRGGSKQTEEAVDLALVWLSQHQNPDGSWSIDHRKGGACQGRCSHPGQPDNCNIAATSLALLPFLGAGQTHKQGKYQKNVQAGLYYLVNRMKVGPNGGDLAYELGGNMYGHGLASIVLCEAYAMTQDRGLAGPAQQAVNFIVYAQDPVGGGWRYAPKMPGDTSVVGWQLMALKSAHMAYLNVPPQTIRGAVNFLNTVQVDSGSGYGYVDPGRGLATTAIGLLCRMYLGWKQDDPALERGAQFISSQGPSPTNMYYNYYATQVMIQYDGDNGPLWTKWNEKMKPQLVSSQAKNGHETGSWYFDERGHVTERGGRLYCTAMSCMTLEVYYRLSPIYKKDSTKDDFVE